jgi:hypothetical protein
MASTSPQPPGRALRARRRGAQHVDAGRLRAVGIQRELMTAAAR